MPMEFVQSQGQIQTLRQELVPAQIQSLEILQVPLQELAQKINEILKENPTLEVVDAGTEQLAGLEAEGLDCAPSDTEFAADSAELAANEPNTSDSDWLSDAGSDEPGSGTGATDLDELWRDYLPGESNGHEQRSDEDEERRQFRFDSMTAPFSLVDSLEDQLRERNDLPEPVRTAAEELLGSLDERGYLRSHLADIAMGTGVSMEEAQQALTLVQSFDPPGVGARDLRECLLLQLERQGRKNSPAHQLVSKHLEAVGRNQIPQVAKEMRLSPNRVYELLEEIRQLRPYPVPEHDQTQAGLANETTFISPEIRIFRKADGTWTVEANREFTPRLRLSRTYLRLLQQDDLDSETKSFIRGKIQESKLLMKALDQRQSTLERISWRLLELQRDFFEQGPGVLHPLTLAQMAQELGLHETTIGRAVANKYMNSPHGVVPFRQFFSSGGIETDAGKLSTLAVKQSIQELIQGEDPAHPLRDEEIVKVLTGNGMNIARRTVAKYREELGVQASHLRRTHR